VQELMDKRKRTVILGLKRIGHKSDADYEGKIQEAVAKKQESLAKIDDRSLEKNLVANVGKSSS
jgi:hypothetical protein